MYASPRMQDATRLHTAVYQNNLVEVQKLLAGGSDCRATSHKVSFTLVFILSRAAVPKIRHQLICSRAACANSLARQHS